MGLLFGAELTTIVNGFGECCSLLRGRLVAGGVVEGVTWSWKHVILFGT